MDYFFFLANLYLIKGKITIPPLPNNIQSQNKGIIFYTNKLIDNNIHRIEPLTNPPPN